ncbi:unnamed protein product [Ectocarpus sp. CCAP 1310/34]|nr:unnamed protein product [Ectocarpus sp. CCAP 1310/34]
MSFGDHCEPDVDWSPCADSTGYPAVLPVYYLCYASLYGSTGLLYATSMGRTVQNQLREKRKLSFNSAIQMHVGIIAFSIAGLIRGVPLKASRKARTSINDTIEVPRLRHKSTLFYPVAALQDMKLVARSRPVLDYLRRVKYVVIGSSVLWCLRTVLFVTSACMDKPLPVLVWAVLRGGTAATGIATALLYYVVIGACQVQKKFQALATIVSNGASQFIKTPIASMGEASARVYVDGDSEEPKLFQRIASGMRWSTRRRVDSGTSSRGSFSKKAAEGGGATAPLRSGTGDSMKVPDELSSETKQPMADTRGAQVGPADPAMSQGRVVGMRDGFTFDVRSADDSDGEGDGKSKYPSVKDLGGCGGKERGGEETWHTPVSPATTPTPSPPEGFTDGSEVPEERKSELTDCEDGDANSGDEGWGEDQQRRKPGLQKRSSWSRAHLTSSDASAGSSSESRKKTEEFWELEELEEGSFYNSS